MSDRPPIAETTQDEARRPAPLRWVVALHRRLLPNHPEIGWTPYLWLFYLSMPIWSWLHQPPEPWIVILGCLSLIAFLFLYFNGYWRKGKRLLWNIGGILMLGLIWSPISLSAMVFFVYAASFTGFLGSAKLGRRALFGIAIVVAAFGFGFLQHLAWTALTLCLCGMIGATNLYYAELSTKSADLRRSQEEIERLATIAERERISRDLHDLLGHTLSVITLKSELARKLAERGDERAAREIAEVEQISRDALRQVREAVEGIRTAGFAGELARARLVCEAREIELESQVMDVALSTQQEAALSMVLREAITNLARHSQASRCRIALEQELHDVTLIVHDDGQVSKTGPEREGHGLQGMRARVAELGGRLKLETHAGWRIEASLPNQPTIAA